MDILNDAFSGFIFIIFFVLVVMLMVSVLHKNTGRIVGFSIGILSTIALAILKGLIVSKVAEKKTLKDIKTVGKNLNKVVDKNINEIKQTTDKIQSANNEIRSMVDDVMKETEEVKSTIQKNSDELSQNNKKMEDKIKSQGFTEEVK